MKFHAVV